MLSARIQSLSGSITMAISSKAAELRAQGKNVLAFSAGEPDFDTPRQIKDAAIDAINTGFTKYTAVDGIPEIKSAIIDKLKRDNNLDYKNEHIIVNNGAKHSLFNLFQAIIDEGDEVIIPAPYWVTYPELVKYSGGVVVELHTDDENAFKITPEQLKNALTEKTKAIILNTPSNPTGSIYTQEELLALGAVLEGTGVLVISDEMYEKLTYEGIFTSAASVSEDMYNRTITINGLSKSVAMTGWRFGYIATPRTDIVASMKRLQSQSTSNINSITQKASVVGLSAEIDAEIELMKEKFVERRDAAVELFNNIDGLSVIKPDGAFYLYVNISEIEQDSMKFCQDLLEKNEVAVVPGLGFGCDGHFRFSFATDLDTIKEGISRIATFVRENYATESASS